MTRSEQTLIGGIVLTVSAALLLAIHLSSPAATPTAGEVSDPETAEFSHSQPSTPAGSVYGSVSGTVAPNVSPDTDPNLSGAAAEGGEAPAAAPEPEPEPEDNWSAPCVASWYGEDHRGLTTASGTAFNPDASTAAMWDVPFGTVLQVRHGGVTVEVEITDRGPARRLGRCIDLSSAAFARLAPLGAGLIDVQILEK